MQELKSRNTKLRKKNKDSLCLFKSIFMYIRLYVSKLTLIVQENLALYVYIINDLLIQ